MRVVEYADPPVRWKEDGGDASLGRARMDGPVIMVCSHSGTDADALAAICLQEHWRLLSAVSAGEALRTPAIQTASLVAVITDGASFDAGIIRAMRDLVSAPAVVIGDLDDMTRVQVLADGADMVLPAGLDRRVLSAQLIALLRRSAEISEPSVRYLRAGDFWVDLWSRTCRLGQVSVALSPTEFHLLVYLMRHAHQALLQLNIVHKLWGPSAGVNEFNALRIQVSRLRRKLAVPGVREPLIRSARGIGYEFTEDVVEARDDAVADTGQDRLSGLSRAMVDLARGLTGTEADAAQFLAGVLVTSAACDAASVFRLQAGRLELVAENGNPPSWREALRAGVPLRPGFAYEQAIEGGKPDEIADIVSGSREGLDGVRVLRADGFHRCRFVPILTETGSWGALGLVSRSRRPFPVAAVTFGTAAASMFAIATRPPLRSGLPLSGQWRMARYAVQDEVQRSFGCCRARRRPGAGLVEGALHHGHHQDHVVGPEVGADRTGCLGVAERAGEHRHEPFLQALNLGLRPGIFADHLDQPA